MGISINACMHGPENITLRKVPVGYMSISFLVSACITKNGKNIYIITLAVAIQLANYSCNFYLHIATSYIAS